MILSCMGNPSQGELSNSENLTLNNVKKLNFHFEKLNGANKCTIPGFQPPNLPNFVIPPFTLFKGLPPFPTLCFLPPFPGLPALSLPAISIPLPPIPLIPPIPLPIPNFSLPLLPFLPSFDLGSLDFLCGLIHITLPVLDPFAALNKLIAEANAALTALNKFLQFCNNNTNAIANTEAPPAAPPAIVNPNLATTPPTSLSPLNLPAGIQMAQPVVSGGPAASPPPSSLPSAVASGSNASTTPAGLVNVTVQQPPTIAAFQAAYKSIIIAATDPAVQLALYLTNQGLLPAEPGTLAKVASLLAAVGGLAKDIPPSTLYNLLVNNNIPSAVGFVGFTGPALDAILATSTTLISFVHALIAQGLLSSNAKIANLAYTVLSSNPSIASGAALSTVSGLELAILLNGSGIPFGTNAQAVASISPDDIARAFFIRSTVLPFTPASIVKVLTLTGVLANVGNNVNQATAQLTPLPSPITPATISAALSGIIAGPAIGSLKAVCIAANQGTSPAALALIAVARQNALVQAAVSGTYLPIVQVFAKVTYNQFQYRLSQFNFPLAFPMSIWEVIPLLAISFNIDPEAFNEFLNNFSVPSMFFSLQDLFSFISTAANSVASALSAQNAITTCQQLQESDFNFTKLTQTVQQVLTKYKLTFPTSASINLNIANALQIELGYNSIQIANVLSTQQFTTIEEITFLMLATGVLVIVTNLVDTLAQQGLSPNISSQEYVSISIQSPSGYVGDILQSTLFIQINTRKYTAAGIINTSYTVVTNGVAGSGSTVVFQSNDIQQSLQIAILRISGFVPAFEAVESVVVTVNFATLVQTNPTQIPSNYISIQF